jgi:hypothetical protein
MRPLVVILIVANLLLCPFQCRGVLSGTTDDGVAAVPTCDCGACRHSQNVPTKAPGSPAHDNGCDSCQCVCGGAIFDEGPSDEITFAVDFFAGDLEPAVALSRAVELQGSPFDGFSVWPSGASSGRELRVRLASLVC